MKSALLCDNAMEPVREMSDFDDKTRVEFCNQPAGTNSRPENSGLTFHRKCLIIQRLLSLFTNKSVGLDMSEDGSSRLAHDNLPAL
jgi:hypothetical protein